MVALIIAIFVWGIVALIAGLMIMAIQSYRLTVVDVHNNDVRSG